MRPELARDLTFHLAGLPLFTCKTRRKRRGWDSNPRDGSTPPTRFPVALLRPTRTPLRDRGRVYQIAKPPALSRSNLVLGEGADDSPRGVDGSLAFVAAASVCQPRGGLDQGR